jgi:predicted transposase YbfD/YdcC
MCQGEGASIVDCFAGMEDPRCAYLRLHKLVDMVVVAICAILCGADNWVEVADFGVARYDWLRKFLQLSCGIPSHDTFGRVFAILDPQVFEGHFLEWVQRVAQVTKGQVVAIDGKALRRSHDVAAGRQAMHMVSAWATENGLALGQLRVADKSSEITAVPELLRLLDVSGCIVTVDAMHCQKETAKEILRQGADYIMAVKDNQPTLAQDVENLFATAAGEAPPATPVDRASSVDKGHGRIEERVCSVIVDPEFLFYMRSAHKDWPELNSLVKVDSRRIINGHEERHSRLFISSLRCDAAEMLDHVRAHWGIENCLHWVLDIGFREDESRVRKGYGAENLSRLRHIALNLLKQDKSLRIGTHAKRLHAAWDPAYLERVLGL